MRTFNLIIVALATTLLAASAAASDRLELTDGRILTGKYQGGTPTVVRMRIDGISREIPTDTIKSLRFDASPTSGSIDTNITQVPAGTVITVQLISTLSSHSSKTGDTFEATLTSDIKSDRGTLLERGALVTGRVVKSQRPRRSSEKAELEVELANVEIQGRARPLKTTIGIETKSGKPEFELRRGEIQFAPQAILEFRLSQPILLRPSRY